MAQTQPQPMPLLPKPEELYALPEPAKAFDEWEASCEQAREANEKLFEKDLKLMGFCALLHGALGLSTRQHFKWCPHDKWDTYWQDLGWPSFPQP